MTDRGQDRGGRDWDRAWFQIDPRYDCVVVTAGGEIDLHTATGLARAVDESLPSSPCLVIDMSRVTFVDSTGLGVLIGARNRARQGGGAVVLVHPPNLVRRLLVGTQLQQTFPVFDTLDEALASIRAT